MRSAIVRGPLLGTAFNTILRQGVRGLCFGVLCVSSLGLGFVALFATWLCIIQAFVRSHFPKIIFGCCFSLLGSSSCNSVSGAVVSIHVEVASLVPRPPSGSGCSVLPNTPTQGWLTSRCMSQGMVLEARGAPIIALRHDGVFVKILET